MRFKRSTPFYVDVVVLINAHTPPLITVPVLRSLNQILNKYDV